MTDDLLPGLGGGHGEIPLPPLDDTVRGASSRPRSSDGVSEAVAFNLEKIAGRLASLDTGLQRLAQQIVDGRGGDAPLGPREDLKEQILEALRDAFAEANPTSPVHASKVITATASRMNDLTTLLGARINELATGSLEPARPKSKRRAGAIAMRTASYLVVAVIAAATGAAYWARSNPPKIAEIQAANPFLEAGNSPRWLEECPRERRVQGNRCAMNMAVK